MHRMHSDSHTFQIITRYRYSRNRRRLIQLRRLIRILTMLMRLFLTTRLITLTTTRIFQPRIFTVLRSVLFLAILVTTHITVTTDILVTTGTTEPTNALVSALDLNSEAVAYPQMDAAC